MFKCKNIMIFTPTKKENILNPQQTSLKGLIKGERKITALVLSLSIPYEND